ncbi:MAG: excinuclease ABC subunit UvrA, partial [Chlamydiia bacterium]|nr:excinuclease ABC subunit UvrA [Chlamydiia bacterium]
KHLLEVLHELVERGNTVIVIEHNMDVVKTADWIIDLGPDGGAGGGRITASGPPEEIALQSTPTGISVDAALKKLQLKAVEKALKKGPVKSKHAPITEISAEGLEQNNLKSISATVPRGKITVCTGPSGSGKSSFAFDTIYAEGQRRYAESLSPYMRQFVLSMPKPKAGRIEGLSPAIAIEQKIHAGNPRSTVGTLTEIYDFLRLLFARLGTPHCPETGEEIKAISKEYVVEKLLGADPGTPLIILAPLQFKRGDNFAELATRLKRQGFVRIRLNGVYHELEEEIPFDAKRKHELLLVVDRLKASSNVRLRLAEAVESAAALGGNTLFVQKGEEDLFFNLSFAVPSTGKSYPPITPHTFSFNTADGMCPYCEGLGFQYGANITQNRDLMQLTSVELIQSLMGEWLEQDVYEALLQLIEEPYTPLCDLKPRALETLLRGDKNHPGISLGGVRLKWRGLDAVFAHAVRSVQQEVQHASEQLTEHIDCIGCHGARVHALARAVTMQGKGIHDICQMPIEEALRFVQKLSLSKEDAKLLDEVMEQLVKRLNLLADIGVGYLTLHRSAPTLSGGEAQRIRLARQLGSGLTGSLYVLDEPTIGLHPEDIERLNRALLNLRDLGNTLLLVEHDPQTITIADKVLDFGPGAGEKGGHLVAQGSLKEILKDKNSRTGQYLSHKLSIPTPKKRRAPKNGALEIKKASAHNLKNLDLAIPIGTLSCLTGVSGSGKSTLVESILIPAMQKGLNLKKSSYTLPYGTVEGIENFEQIISIDQQPIGHTSRSNVGTYVEAVDRMRKFFAELPLAKAKGLDGRHFSFNHRRGMCTRCWGMGYRKVEMHFLPPVRIPCDE